MTTSEQEALTEGEAGNDHAEYYRMQLDGETVDLRCFGGTAFVQAADDASLEGRRDNIGAYRIWMEDRNGSGAERVPYEDTIFVDVDKRREEKGIGQ